MKVVVGHFSTFNRPYFYFHFENYQKHIENTCIKQKFLV